jgi:hypothetical protein
MAKLPPPPCLPDLVPHEVTKGEINIAHAPPSSPASADNAPAANLFCNLQGFSQNKRLSLLREKSDHTPARKKHGGMMHCASYVKLQGAIEELLLATLHVNDSFNHSAEWFDLHRPIVTPNCGDVNDRDNKGDTSDNKDYHPMSIVPPPSCLPKQERLSQEKYLIVCF